MTVPRENLAGGTALGEIVTGTNSPGADRYSEPCTADRSMPGPYIGLAKNRTIQKPKARNVSNMGDGERQWY